LIDGAHLEVDAPYDGGIAIVLSDASQRDSSRPI
jgi:hypothetical protein